MTQAAAASGRGSGPGEAPLLAETWTYLGGNEAEQPAEPVEGFQSINVT